MVNPLGTASNRDADFQLCHCLTPLFIGKPETLGR